MQFDQFKHAYWVRLSASVDVVRLLITQGLAFRGHDESKSSLSKGNFLQILSWYAKTCDKIRDYVLEHAPQNDQMTSPMIQKYIVSACKIETIKAILEELNGDYFSLVVDESFDVSRKEQMAIVLRYIDRNGFVMERLLDIVHVQDTSALSLKRAIVNLLAQHSLSLSHVRGQCYDGASNMQGITNELNKCLQKKDQDLANAMLLVEVAKRRLQAYRDDGWNSLIAKVSLFCIKHGILIPNFEDPYVSSLRSRRRLGDNKVSHHYHVEVFCNIIDWQLQELKDRFG
ncbi:uncharacterized protein LOC132624643 [Lycium barbarum]|uniref:uncharacterized protein LOC132624643 n=1 Tax=Lycium barbarum TaxID=112863 RepID=UPI00293E6AA5|nr:uncharacterized protein LOC132624643 [Lycium barbarum]